MDAMEPSNKTRWGWLERITDSLAKVKVLYTGYVLLPRVIFVCCSNYTMAEVFPDALPQSLAARFTMINLD